MNFYICFLILPVVYVLPIENFIGKNIVEFPRKTLEEKSWNNENGKTFIFPDSELSFFSKKLTTIIITTDKDGIIQSISSDFPEIVNEDFFLEIKAKYGNPTFMHKMKNIEEKEIELLENGVQAVTSTGELVECEFNESPLFIRWQKPDFDIILTFYYGERRTHLTIGKRSF